MKKNKTVVICILQLHKTAAGAMRNTYEQIRYFKSRGWNVHVISDLIDKQAVREAGAIPHRTLKWPGTGTFRRKFYDLQVQFWIKLAKPDLVIGHGDLSQQDVLCLHNSVHLAHELIHGSPLAQNSEMYPIHTPQLQHRRFKHLIANSHLMRNDLMNRFGIPSEMISVIYPAYDHLKFTPTNVEGKRALRQRFGVKDSEVVVGLITSGNFRKRGVDIFFDALKVLPQSIKESTRFWVVGKDKLPQAPEGIRIEQMPICEDVENYYRTLDLFVLPARIEEFGRSQLEAMACGIPVISTRYVGCSELFGDDASECVLEDLTPQALAAKITKFVNCTRTRLEYAAKARERALVASEENLGKGFDSVFSKFVA